MRKLCNPADFAGNFIREVEPRFVKRSNPKKDGTYSLTPIRRVELKCLNKKCNKLFIVDYHNAKRIKQTCCSSKCRKEMDNYFEGGNEKHPLYKRWLAMIQRCRTSTTKCYHRYGGRGITVEPYLQDFIQYVEYVMNLPNAPISFPTKLQLDRINNDGNYERGNLRWVLQSTNMANASQPKKLHKDKYVGVNWSIRKQKYCVRLKYNKKLHFLGWFDDELEGAKFRDLYIIKHNLPNKLNNV